MAHVPLGLRELDDLCTVTSIDGISAYDLVSRVAMFDGLLNRVGGEACSCACSTDPSRRTCGKTPMEWKRGARRRLLPLFCLGQHSALEAVQEDMREGEFLFVLLDDIYIVTRLERGGSVCVCS